MKYIITILLAIAVLLPMSCKTSEVQSPPNSYSYNDTAAGTSLRLEFTRGNAYNYPLMAFWVEDTAGNFIQTLFVAESIGKGYFDHVDARTGKWMPGPIMRPAALPYWSHRRGVENPDGSYLPDQENPVADAYTGPTPVGNFRMNTKLENKDLRKFRIYMEINQTWDWNEFWTNSKYPDDSEYKTSCQPALVYAADIDLESSQKVYELKVIGHSHYSGRTGELFSDLSTITTALDIVKDIRVVLP
jgi:hypothetical protein